MYTKCQYCGKDKRIRKDYLNRKYCSRECRKKAMNVLVKCMTCNKEFYRLKSSLSHKRIFCSRKCKHENKEFKEYYKIAIKNSPRYKESIKKLNKSYNKSIRNSPNTEFKKGWQYTERGREIIKKRIKSLSSGMSKPEKKLLTIIVFSSEFVNI